MMHDGKKNSWKSSIHFTFKMNEDNDIAIVGIGCIFPGAENIEEFWKVLVNGEDHVQDIPPERFNVEAYYDPDPDHPYKSYVRKAGLLQR